MGDRDDGLAPRLHGFQNLGQPSVAIDVLTGGGFIKNQDFRSHGNNGGDGDEFPHGKGQIHGIFAPIDVHAGNLQGILYPTVLFLHAQFHVLGAEANLLLHRCVEDLVVRVLEHVAHDAGDLRRGIILCVHVPHQDVALGRAEQTVDHLDRGGLARAVLADNGHVFAALDVDAHVIHCQEASGIGEADISQAQILHCVSLPFSAAEIISTARFSVTGISEIGNPFSFSLLPRIAI